MSGEVSTGSFLRASPPILCPARGSGSLIFPAYDAALFRALDGFFSALYFWASVGVRFRPSRALKSSYFGRAVYFGRLLEML